MTEQSSHPATFRRSTASPAGPVAALRWPSPPLAAASALVLAACGSPDGGGSDRFRSGGDSREADHDRHLAAADR